MQYVFGVWPQPQKKKMELVQVNLTLRNAKLGLYDI